MTLKDVNEMCPHCADADRATLSALRSVSKANALVVELVEALENMTWRNWPIIDPDVTSDLERARNVLKKAKEALGG